MCVESGCWAQVRYMEVTEAITISMQERRTVALPLLHRN